MRLAPQITFRDMPRSEAIEAEIRRRVEKLEDFCDRIISCRVTVQTPGARKHQGKAYAIHVDLKLPGEEIASTRRHEDEDVYVAIRDAFDAVRRRLEDTVRRQRGETKQHEPLRWGRVVRLLDDGRGFIEDGEGNAYYFDQAAVVRSAERIAVGSDVEFLAEAAAQGLQAKRVTIRQTAD